MADTYGANKGEIATPATNSVVDSLKESHGSGSSLPVRHNEHYGSFNKGASIIESPATDNVTS